MNVRISECCRITFCRASVTSSTQWLVPNSLWVGNILTAGVKCFGPSVSEKVWPGNLVKPRNLAAPTHAGPHRSCCEWPLQGNSISHGLPLYLAEYKFVQYFILEFQLLLSLAVQYPKAVKFFWAIQHGSGRRKLLEALDMKEHTQQANMRTEDQCWIEDNFGNLKFISILLC